MNIWTLCELFIWTLYEFFLKISFFLFFSFLSLRLLILSISSWFFYLTKTFLLLFSITLKHTSCSLPFSYIYLTHSMLLFFAVGSFISLLHLYFPSILLSLAYLRLCSRARCKFLIIYIYIVYDYLIRQIVHFNLSFSSLLSTFFFY